MKKLLLLLLAMCLFAAPSMAQTFSRGLIWTGTQWVYQASDPFGIARTTEEYPITTQYTSPVVASPQSVFWCLYTTLQPFGTTWAAYPYGQKTLYLTRTATGASTAQSVIVYVFGSEDGATFQPVMVAKGLTTTGNQANWLTSYADTTNQDTLKIAMPKRGGSVVTGAYSIPDWLYLGRYVQLYATKSDTVASGAVTLGARWGGREK